MKINKMVPGMVMILFCLALGFCVSVHNAFAGNASLAGQPNKDDSLEWWNHWSGFFSFISILFAVGFFICEIFYEKYKTKNEFKERISRALLTLKNDVEDIKADFTTKDYDKQKDENLDITYTQIGTEVYDSILSSGLFTYFQKQSQLQLGNFYFNIKLHNKSLSEKTRFKFEHDLGYGSKDKSIYENVNQKLGRHITKYESVIKDLFPKVEHYLDGELKRVKYSKFIIPDYKPSTKV